MKIFANKAYDYKAGFHVKQVKLILNGDRVMLSGARAQYDTVDDLLQVKAHFTESPENFC